MLACDGRVTTLWAWAAVKTRPPAARPSRFGVAARRLPAKPRASARRVSMVTRRTSGRGAAAAATGPPARTKAAKRAPTDLDITAILATQNESAGQPRPALRRNFG